MSTRRSGPSGPQLLRLQKLIEWLRSGRRINARLVAEAFEVSRRTVASDIAWLQAAGVPLTYDVARQSYVLTEPFENLPVLPLRRNELAAFLVASHALEALGDTHHAGLLEQVVARLAEHLPDTVRIEPHLLARTIRIDPGPHIALPHLETLFAAAEDHRLIRIRYHANSSNEETERNVEPYAILSYQSRWYLIAYCRLRQEMRDFRVDQIRAIQVLLERFTMPHGFNLDAYLGPAFGMHRGDRTYAVHVRFSPYQARWIREEQWHPSQILIQRQDGSLDVMMQVSGLSDVARWVLSYGAECEVIGPPILRRRIAVEARRLAQRYGHRTGVLRPRVRWKISRDVIRKERQAAKTISFPGFAYHNFLASGVADPEPAQMPAV